MSHHHLSYRVSDYLQRCCGLCSHCVSFVVANDIDTSNESDADTDGSSHSCTVCCGISSSSYQTKLILPVIQQSFLPYFNGHKHNEHQLLDGDAEEKSPITITTNTIPPRTSCQENHLMKESPTVNLPWFIAIRAHCAVLCAKSYIATKKQMESTSTDTVGIQLRTAEDVFKCIKEHVRSSMHTLIMDTLQDDNSSNTNQDASDSHSNDGVILTPELHKEESGYLGVHILILPPCASLSSISLNDTSSIDIEQLIPSSFQTYVQKQKRQIQQINHRILNPRKRFRGNDPTLKQGGDPKVNLELRVRRSMDQNHQDGVSAPHGDSASKRPRLEPNETSDQSTPRVLSTTDNELHEWNMILSWLEKGTVLQWIEEESPARQTELSTWFDELSKSSSNQQCFIHATAWRRPFYVQGTYTKSRRDVSQTPFYVPASPKTPAVESQGKMANGDNGGKASGMIRKGVSSVEDEICPHLALVGCGGISVLNNEQLPSEATSQQHSDSQKGDVVYGLCKFHASGREDLDVRMLLPPPSIAKASAKSNISITGRPFVCQVYDAHRMPTKSDLEKVVKAINCLDGKAAAEASSSEETNTEDTEHDAKGWPTTSVDSIRYHGNNPNGVGVSSPLSLVPARAFSSLQSETEDKVKYYGCVCWTSVPIASDDELVQKLGCLHWDKEGDDNDEAATRSRTSSIYPLEIKQSTPLRVLHRRSSDVRTRHVLSLSACRIDDHWFRLRMSTSAGTYVKEFVHGDCGRSYPSIGSMLGGRTDITELDCEGIAI